MPATAAIDNETLDHLWTTEPDAAGFACAHFGPVYIGFVSCCVPVNPAAFRDFVPPVCP
jgi:hypothetical protein